MAHRNDLLNEMRCLQKVGNHENILKYIGVVENEPGTNLLRNSFYESVIMSFLLKEQQFCDGIQTAGNYSVIARCL